MPSISNLSFSVQFDLTGTPKLVLTDDTPGAPVDMTGIFYITTPDGYTRSGSWGTPDVDSPGDDYEYTLPLAGDNNIQQGEYSVTFEAIASGYTPTTLTRTFVVSYEPVEQVIDEEFDVFTPELVVGDDSVYGVAGWDAPVVTRAWNVTVGGVGSVTGSGTTLDLAIGGQYYDAEYTIVLTSTVEYQHTTYSWLTLIDELVETVATTANTPPDIDEFLEMLNALHDNVDSLVDTCQSYEQAKADYEYAFILYRHIRDRVCADMTTDLYDYIQEFLNIYYNYVNTYVNTDDPIPAYDIDAVCGGSSGLFQEYIVGTTPGAPSSGSSSWSVPNSDGRDVVLFIGRILQSKLDDGSGVYYAKPLVGTTLTLTGATFNTGDLIQVIIL